MQHSAEMDPQALFVLNPWVDAEVQNNVIYSFEHIYDFIHSSSFSKGYAKFHRLVYEKATSILCRHIPSDHEPNPHFHG